MLAFACPSCRKRTDWPDDWRGEKVDCPFCGKSMELIEQQRYRDDEADRDDRPRRRDRDERREVVSRRERDEDDRRPRRRREATCPRCGCRDEPLESKEMAENAWIFIVIGIFFWPLIILGVLMKETWEVCPECRFRFNKIGGTTFG